VRSWSRAKIDKPNPPIYLLEDEGLWRDVVQELREEGVNKI
jgi:hypothetical protein